jgi:hypothetical protein
MLCPNPKPSGTYVLRSAEGDTGDARDVLQAELANGLTGLLLVAGLDADGGAGRDVGLLAGLGLGAAAGLFDVGLAGDLLIGELFDTRIGHDCGGRACGRVDGQRDRSLRADGRPAISHGTGGNQPVSREECILAPAGNRQTYLERDSGRWWVEVGFFGLMEDEVAR